MKLQQGWIECIYHSFVLIYSVAEVYAQNGDVVITSRVYPTLPDSTGVELFAVNASALFQLTAWEMADI